MLLIRLINPTRKISDANEKLTTPTIKLFGLSIRLIKAIWMVKAVKIINDKPIKAIHALRNDF